MMTMVLTISNNSTFYGSFTLHFPPCLVEPKWSPALSTMEGIMSMGMLNMLNAQAAYWWVKGSYIPVAAMLDTAHHDKTRVHNTALRH